MRTSIRRAGLLVATVAVLGSTAVASQAAVTDHDVRQDDFTVGGDDGFANSDTRATGHLDFLKEGVRLYTEGNTSTDKVAEYFPVNRPLAGITNVDYDWYGTTPSPGQQYVMDFDNDGSQDGILVGEKVYGGQDVWLTNASKAEYKGTGAPSNTGGSGTENHGTLAEWSEKYPNARITHGGFSLGSGVKGDGVLRALTYGNDRYVFTDLEPVPDTPAATERDVTGDVSASRPSYRALDVLLVTDANGPNQVDGAKLPWSINTDGYTAFATQMGSGQRARWKMYWQPNTGKHTVEVFKAGKRVRTYTVDTRR